MAYKATVRKYTGTELAVCACGHFAAGEAVYKQTVIPFCKEERCKMNALKQAVDAEEPFNIFDGVSSFLFIGITD